MRRGDRTDLREERNRGSLQAEIMRRQRGKASGQGRNRGGPRAERMYR